ncbi:methyltransferase-like protein 24 [Aplysia californica]|uniref:Methyltransferase-like protein 24 n=1 Tax=Aplysia californica TaxID=6500 RepID=A0ABM0JK63_APLCA|nr:methyltransferase-like protein 24 [Aplysia californica]
MSPHSSYHKVVNLVLVPAIWRIPGQLEGRDPQIGKQWWEWACLLEKEWDKKPEYKCENVQMAGLYHTCFDKKYKPTPPCLVYSFGIDNDFSFDDDMAKHGCEVYSFDPSMGVEDHQRSERVHFFNMGLATTDSDSFEPVMDTYTFNKHQKWKIRTLSSIKKMLGHENRAIDILKIDIESYEWAVMNQILKDGLMDSVRQFLLEWHIFPNEPMRCDFKQMYETYMELKKIGFRQFHKNGFQRYHSFEYFNSQLDESLVNTMFKEKE